jgi:preprotein translocase subunit SecA
MAQRNPLVEYQREGYDMFAAMMDGIKEESVGLLFNLEVQQPAVEEGEPEGPVLVAKGLVAPKAPSELEYSAPTVDGAGGVVHRTERPAQAAESTADGAGEAEPEGEPGKTRGRRTRSRGRRR